MTGCHFYARSHRYVFITASDIIFAIFALACISLYLSMAIIAIFRQVTKTNILTKSILVVRYIYKVLVCGYIIIDFVFDLIFGVAGI